MINLKANNDSNEEGMAEMKIYYDNMVDALYLKLGDGNPEGVVELSEGVNLDQTSDGKIVGIEILNASNKIDIKTILSYSLEFDRNVLSPNVVV